MSVPEVAAPIVVLKVRDDLRALLASDHDYDGVKVFVVEPSPEVLERADLFVLIRTEVPEPEAYLHPDRSRDVDVRVPGYATAYSSKPGFDESFVEAWQRVADLVGQLVRVCKAFPSYFSEMNLATVLVESVGYRPIVMDKGGWGCHANFTLHFSVRLDP